MNPTLLSSSDTCGFRMAERCSSPHPGQAAPCRPGFLELLVEDELHGEPMPLLAASQQGEIVQLKSSRLRLELQPKLPSQDRGAASARFVAPTRTALDRPPVSARAHRHASLSRDPAATAC